MVVYKCRHATTAMEYQLETQVLSVDPAKIGDIIFQDAQRSFLGHWTIRLSTDSPDAANLVHAAHQLRNSNIPVAFPTETVYGLGADATREIAVAGIYTAKGRPADNPLIVHVCSLPQLRNLLLLGSSEEGAVSNLAEDPIPSIYHPLIYRFWPGPLTILLPLPKPSPLAKSVTGSLPTFGVRMPSSRLALALINLANVPVAAPSANASTKPSPTTAAHVRHDLCGRINLILDGGPCAIGVESTVVDGLSHPPVILRPGGISIEHLRECPGWEGVVIGYNDGAEISVPRAPGMKYKHYSPKARVILVQGSLSTDLVKKYRERGKSVGLIRTKMWNDNNLAEQGWLITREARQENFCNKLTLTHQRISSVVKLGGHTMEADPALPELAQKASTSITPMDWRNESCRDLIEIWTVDLGTEAITIARGLFSALRELDLCNVSVILVEAIDDAEGDAAAAIMNRLRKAAELQVKV